MKRNFEKLENEGKKLFDTNPRMYFAGSEVAELIDNAQPCITKDDLWELLWKGILIGAAIGSRMARKEMKESEENKVEESQ